MSVYSLPRRVLAATSFFVVASASLSAQSSVNPATIQIYQLGPGFNSYTSPGTYATATGFTTVSLNPYTLISTRSTGNAQRETAANNAFVDYFFMMQGMTGRVTAKFTADLFVSLNGRQVDENTGARANFTLSSAGNGRFYDAIGNPLTSGPFKDLRPAGMGSTRFNDPVTFTVDANAMYMVSLFAGTQTSSPGLTVEAYVDPTITISPAQQSAYTLILSPGISNLLPPTTTTVPEPASLLLVGGGLMGIVAVVRRRPAH